MSKLGETIMFHFVNCAQHRVIHNIPPKILAYGLQQQNKRKSLLFSKSIGPFNFAYVS